jgi:hypothetical protein
MSLFSLFSRKPLDLSSRVAGGDKVSVTGSSQPVVTSQNKPFVPSSEGSGASTSGKSVEDKSRQVQGGRDSLAAQGMAEVAENERRRVLALERREQLYSSVRESLLRVEILAASYRFKVLALDQSGQQFLVMIDLPSNISRSAIEITKIETLIADNAKSHYELVVKSVYWRLDDELARVNMVPPPAVRAPTAQPPTAQPPNDEVNKPAVLVMEDAPQSRGFDPLESEEMLAFKRALAAKVSEPTALVGAQPPSHDYHAVATSYEDTEMAKL